MTDEKGRSDGGTTPIETGEAGEGSSTSIDRPRLTPQGRTAPEASGEDSTNPMGSGAKGGQPSKAEG